MAPDLLEVNLRTCVFINAMGYNALEGEKFEIDESIAPMAKYNKPITNKELSDNKNSNYNKNMKSNKIRLTESQLNRVIKERVKKGLKEGDENMLTTLNRAKQEVGWQIVSMYTNNLDSFNHETFENWCDEGEMFQHLDIPDNVCDECIKLMHKIAPLVDSVTNLLTFDNE